MNVDNFNLKYIYNDYCLDFIERNDVDNIFSSVDACTKLFLEYINVSMFVYIYYNGKVIVKIADHYLGHYIYVNSHHKAFDVLMDTYSKYEREIQTFEYELEILNGFLEDIEKLGRCNISKKYGLR